jgi:predicted nucleotide-binding protein (sugar kinase/HSP70/actin superfamily)
MRFTSHRCVTRKVGPGHPLAGKVLYIPAMAEGSVEALASVFRWLGIEAHPTPHSDARTRELGARYTSGDECYPAKVTVGDFLKIIQQPGFDPKRTVFMMATADGPCRFGQYAPCLRKVLRELGYGDVQIFAPRGQRGYSDIGEFGTPFLRAAWRALVSADILRKLLLQTRPYETVPGTADTAFHESLRDFCQTLETSCSDYACQLRSLLGSLERGGRRFRAVPASYDSRLPLIAVVGEIFCRLNTFSNEDLVRRLESYRAECWMTDIAEWIAYTNTEEIRDLGLAGQSVSLSMLKSKLRNRIQHADMHALLDPFAEDFLGYEEPEISEIIELANPYLRYPGAEGEMVVSVGRSAYLAKHGVDGVVDISPFACMNGIVSEAIYPKLSQNYGAIPIRNFYFDGTQSDLDRDIEVFLELARSYHERKQYPRKFPTRFTQQESEGA